MVGRRGRRKTLCARVARVKWARPIMTDAQLIASVAELAPLDRRSTAGVNAIFDLASKLALEPQFLDQPIRAVGSGQGSHTISAEYVAQRMLNIAKTAGRSAAEAVAWFRRIPSITRGVGGAVKALYGVRCTERIAMSDDVVLLPYLELPPSETRDWVLREHEKANESLLLYGFTVAPQAALYRPGTVEPFFLPPGHDFTKTQPASWSEDLETAALLLAMTPRAVPAEAANWMHYDDPDIASLGNFGIRRNLSDFPSPFRMSDPGLVTAQSAHGLLTLYRKVNKASHRERLRLTLQRLIRSRNQLHLGNRAIDLAIALEVLFMNAERDEHSYKISLRAARLLRTSLDDRRTAFGEIRRVYDIRSGMVHTGSADDQWNVNGIKRSSYEIVEASDSLCSESLRRFLELGYIPEAEDWRKIELS